MYNNAESTLSSVRLLDAIQSGEATERKAVEAVASVDDFLSRQEAAHRQPPMEPTEVETTSEPESVMMVEGHLPPVIHGALRLTARTFAGIEMSDRSIRLALVQRAGRIFQLLRAVESAGSSDELEQVTELKRLVRKYKLDRRPVISVLDSVNVNVRLLRMPRVSRKEIHEALLWKNKKELHFFNDAPTVLHYVIVEDGETAPQSGEFFVLVVAVKEEAIRHHLELLSRAGLKPFKLIIRPVAKWSLIRQLTTLEKPSLVVDVGFDTTEVTFYDGNALHFAREIMIGGSHFTKALCQPVYFNDDTVTLTWEEAEKLKNHWGLSQPPQTVKEKGIPASEFTDQMRPVVEKLIKELKLSVDYYLENFKSEARPTMYLTGNGARLSNLPFFVASSLELNVQILQPGESIACATELPADERSNLAGCLNAIGAALSAGNEFNFLPQEKINDNKHRRALSWVLTSASMLASTFAITVGLMFFRNSLENNTLEQTRAALTHIESQQTTYGKIVRERDKYRTQSRQLSGELVPDPSVVQLLRMVSVVTPEAIILEEMTWGNGYNETEIQRLRTAAVLQQKGAEATPVVKQVIIQGEVYKDLFYADLHLLDFISALERTGAFASVELKSKERDVQTERLTFTLLLQPKVKS